MRHSGSALRRGFTLIELLVASAVMALLVLMVVGLTDNVLNLWGKASGRLASNAEARVALNYLGDDIETMVVRSNRNHAWLEVRYDRSRHGPNPAARKVMLTLITATEHHDREKTVSGNVSAGSICAVHYRMDYGNPIVDNAPLETFGLYRTVLDPRNTFTEIMDTEFTGNYTTGTYAQLEAFPGFTTAATSFANYLCSNIIEMTVIFYAEHLDNNGNATIVPLTQGYVEGGEPLDFIYADGVYLFQGGVPELEGDLGNIVSAEIRLVALSDRGAKQIAANTNISEARVKAIIQSEGEVFTRKVPIMSRH